MAETNSNIRSEGGESANARYEDARNRFPAFIGVRTEHASQGNARCTLEQREHNTNAFESVHGGAVASLIDIAVTAAARSIASDVVRVATLSLTTSYLLPATGRITADAEVLSSGKRIASVRADARRADGTLLATALASIRLQRARAGDD